MSMKKFNNPRHGASSKKHKKRVLNLITRADIITQNQTIIENIQILRHKLNCDDPIRICIKPEIVQKQYSIIVKSTIDPKKAIGKTISLALDPFEFYWETTKTMILKAFDLKSCNKGISRSYEFY